MGLFAEIGSDATSRLLLSTRTKRDTDSATKELNKEEEAELGESQNDNTTTTYTQTIGSLETNDGVENLDVSLNISIFICIAILIIYH